MKLYTNEAVNRLISKWQDMNGDINIIKEGCLASVGLAVLTKEGYKTIVIKEKYLNEWSSCQIVRRYNKTPKKYMELIKWKP